MLKIEFKNEKTEVVSGTNARGRAYAFRKQEGFLHGNGPYPERVVVTVPDGLENYPAGEYEITHCFERGKFDALVVARDLGLRPIKGATRVVA